MSTQVTVIDEVRTGLQAMQPQFRAALPAHVTPEKFMRVTMTAIQQNPDLMKADRRTLYGAAMRAAQQGLMPDGREGAIVTFGQQAQWMPMVAGIMKLCRNSGEISVWSVQAVHENDAFDYQLGDDERITHKPALKNRGDLVGAYSIVVMKDGERSREFMNIDEIEAIRKRSRSGNAGPWRTDLSEMAKKTVVRRHAKRLPMSTDLDEALRADDEDNGPQFAPEAPAPAVHQDNRDPAPAKPRARASRLQAVADQAPAERVDEDGVIEMEATPPSEMYDDQHDSPI